MGLVGWCTGYGLRSSIALGRMTTAKDYAASIRRHKVKDDIPDDREEQCYFGPDQ